MPLMFGESWSHARCHARLWKTAWTKTGHFCSIECMPQYGLRPVLRHQVHRKSLISVAEHIKAWLPGRGVLQTWWCFRWTVQRTERRVVSHGKSAAIFKHSPETTLYELTCVVICESDPDSTGWLDKALLSPPLLAHCSPWSDRFLIRSASFILTSDC